MKSILIIVPYDPVYPPMNGGMQRCFNIIIQLAKHFELSVIINQKKEELLRAVNGQFKINNINVYSTQDAAKPKDIFNFLPQKLRNALRYRWYKKQVKGAADGNFLLYYPVLTKVLIKQSFDVIILENLATINAVSVIRKYSNKAKIIYDAHNVDTNLGSSFLNKGKLSRKRFAAISKIESTLHKTVDVVLACSKKDKEDFLRLNKNKLTVSIIPNGVNILQSINDEQVKNNNPSYILFCGYLNSLPNYEGLLWFYISIWPKIKDQFHDLKMLIVGSGNLPVSMNNLLQDSTLVFTGEVKDVKPYYEQSAISIAPIKTGSGTRLKILEAMSFGVPVVSTTQGAEGINYTDEVDIMIADEENLFAEKIIYLLRNREKRLSLQKNARQLVTKKYDWNIIGDSLAQCINNVIPNN